MPSHYDGNLHADAAMMLNRQDQTNLQQYMRGPGDDLKSVYTFRPFIV